MHNMRVASRVSDWPVTNNSRVYLNEFNHMIKTSALGFTSGCYRRSSLIYGLIWKRCVITS